MAGQTLTYDNNGNLTSDGTRTYVYDVENRLISVSGGGDSATLSYDPNGRLFQTVINGATTRFVYDGDALVAELNGNNGVLRRYVHGSNVDSPLVWMEGSGTGDRRFYHADHQGSIIALSNSNGGVLHTTSYSPYGVPDGLMPGRFAYTGQAVLPGLDLYHYKARVYSPTLGRFLQTDPIGYEDQQNIYAYVGNDPMNYTDPTGMQEDEIETYGKPQVTRGANGQAHAAGSVDIGNEIKSSVEGARRQHYNQSMRTITGDNTASRMMPDVAVVHGDSVTVGEKVSPSQTELSQTRKWSNEVGKTYTNQTTGEKLTVRGPIVRAIPGLEALTAVTGMMSGRIDFSRGIEGAVADATGHSWMVPACRHCSHYVGTRADGMHMYWGTTPDGTTAVYDFYGNYSHDVVF